MPMASASATSWGVPLLIAPMEDGWAFVDFPGKLVVSKEMRLIRVIFTLYIMYIFIYAVSFVW